MNRVRRSVCASNVRCWGSDAFGTLTKTWLSSEATSDWVQWFARNARPLGRPRRIALGSAWQSRIISPWKRSARARG